MRKLVFVLLAPVVLAGTLVWLVSRQAAAHRGPAGGSGTVEGTETFVTAKVLGRLLEVRVREGDAVHRGDVLARLDCREHEAALAAASARVSNAEAQVLVAQRAVLSSRDSAYVASAQIEAAKARTNAMGSELSQAERELSRAEQLKTSGVVTLVELERADTRKDNLLHQVSSASAETLTTKLRANAASNAIALEQAKFEAAKSAVLMAIAEQKRSELVVDECNLSAPSDGVVTHRLEEPGSVVTTGSRVLTVLDLTTAKVVFYLPNAQLAQAKPGALAEVAVDAYPGRLFQGTVRRIASEAEFTPRNVQTREDRDRLVFAVEVEVPNSAAELRAGMPAEVRLTGTEPRTEPATVGRP